MAVRRLVFPLLLFFLYGLGASPGQHTAPRQSARPARTHRAATQDTAQFPNILVITLDTTRADRMGFLGSTRGLTPNLDAMAKQGVVFERAYSHVPLTTASHSTI